MAIYMIEFSQVLGNVDKAHGQAKRYLGYCDDSRIAKRFAEHCAGRGSSITRAAVEQGYDLEIVMLILGGSRRVERALKNRKNHRKLLRQFHRGTLNIKHYIGASA